MKGGLVLILTDKNESSATKVIEHLREIDQPFSRIDVSSVFESQSKIKLNIKTGILDGYVQCRDGNKIDIESVKSVWVRRPKPISVPASWTAIEKQFIEDEFTSALWSFCTCLGDVYWMNHPLYSRHLLEHNKLYQLKLATASGLRVPATLVTNDPEQLIDFCEKSGGSIAIKAVRSRIFQESPGIASGIYTNRVFTDYLKQHAADIALAPIMAQEYVPKKLEFRVTVVGHQVLACAIYSQDSERTKDDWRRYDFAKVKHENRVLPEDINIALLRLMDKCCLTYGAMDMILTPEGEYFFLEVNPSGQYEWIENLTKLPISRSIAEALANTDTI
ncbi:hypothetical protein A2631_01475 [Candidatus Daviesbacteria bacterium RIFCSPHIGHO2_01_FULL_44_29]|nr:MAG: hypothetical protein A2631_01475 [Candidatus Daviesbacteria bacterium RIFCSPHIGHO2_01_FULL_44_29]OGE69926.1 MAG: hypothetical protein A3B55_00040 [Candidatus Daviesbacteria bacterium RIFCSPLOWO2_01_FULL_43_15]